MNSKPISSTTLTTESRCPIMIILSPRCLLLTPMTLYII